MARHHPFSKLPFLSILALALSSTLSHAARVTNPSKVPKDAVPLSKISTLTLRSGRSTSSRRVSPVPQLQCTGPSSVCSLYKVDTIRCKNEGADYDEHNMQWTCSASLPDEFKLGGTDVTCEGYESSDDPYVLKGSCGVEYRLLLTEKGERKYGMSNDEDFWGSLKAKSRWDKLGTFLFWLVFGGVVGAMILSAFGCLGTRGAAVAGGGRPGWGGGGGGGGGFNDDPPPPYSGYRSSSKFTRSTPSSYGQRGGGEQWRPGFWTGAGAGAAAGYMMGNRGRNETGGGLFGRQGEDTGERSSRSSSGPSYSSGRYESTGFGSTSRR